MASRRKASAANTWIKVARAIQISPFALIAACYASSPAFAEELRVAVGRPIIHLTIIRKPKTVLIWAFPWKCAKRLPNVLGFSFTLIALFLPGLSPVFKWAVPIWSAISLTLPSERRLLSSLMFPVRMSRHNFSSRAGGRLAGTDALCSNYPNIALAGSRDIPLGRNTIRLKNLNKINADDEDQQIKMLLAGRFDIGIGSKPAILFHAKQLGVENQLLFLEPLLVNAPVFMAFSKRRPDAAQLAAEFSRELDKFKKTFEYRSLLQKYNMAMPKQ